MKILFVCSANIDRSPTAELIYSSKKNLEVKSAGVSDYAMTPITIELIQWADIILCMEKKHMHKIKKKYSDIVPSKVIDSLNVPDVYEYMNIELVNIIREKTDMWLNNYHIKKYNNELVEKAKRHITNGDCTPPCSGG
ncbi:MAG: hypothetical protein FWG46_01865 [Treponema sp.]|nr:hypothetical protein [Treponema sp.]